MKALSKPLSSPGRPEKFPPPLMRFLRSNIGSRSRGRSRASPLFYLRSKKRPPAGVIPEPSSPKVTCIGQVRVRRRKNDAAVADVRRRRRPHRSPFSCGFPKKSLGKMFCSLFRSGCCGGKGENSRVYSDRKSEQFENYGTNNNNNNNNRRSVCSDGGITGDGFPESASTSSSPPRNALLLTRCRSAPYRSSSLGGRFWADEKLGEMDVGGEGKKSPGESEKVVGETGKKAEDSKEANHRGIVAVHPLLLTRCKSEPARNGERLVVTESFLLQRRLD